MLLLVGCSLSLPWENPPLQAASPEAITVELFMKRGSLFEESFQQFQLRGGTLYQECGQVNQGKFVPKSNAVTKLNSEDFQELTEKADKVVSLYSEKPPVLAAPGRRPTSFFDPGELEFKVTLNGKKASGNTALDAISQPSSDVERAINKLVVNLKEKGRNIPNQELPCGAQSFFGL